jgi:hypothetical protein
MKYLICMCLAFLLCGQCIISAQQSGAAKVEKLSLKKETFQVYGNCDMCKRTIEGVAKKSGAKTATWNKETHLLTIEFDPNKITLEQIQNNIAAVGYDNAGQYGSDTAYARLPECCQYERKPKE